MKRLFVKTVVALIFSILLSSPSYAEWTEVADSISGDVYYVDFDRIRQHNGYVLYWELTDNVVPITSGSYLSSRKYIQIDCSLFRYKFLSVTVYKEPMGGGSGKTIPTPGEYADWKYLPPESVSEEVANVVCDSVR